MDATAAKLIGAGIACIGMGGAGVGVGLIFGNYLAAALRNPCADTSGHPACLHRPRNQLPNPGALYGLPR